MISDLYETYTKVLFWDNVGSISRRLKPTLRQLLVVAPLIDINKKVQGLVGLVST